MSFSKAPIKRFNDGTEETPGPNSYCPKTQNSSVAASIGTARRFVQTKEVIPGPGQYDVLLKTGLKADAKSSSLSSSTCSLEFKTPSKPSKNVANKVESMKKTILDLKSQNESLADELQVLRKQIKDKSDINDLTEKLAGVQSNLDSRIIEIDELRVQLEESERKAKSDLEDADARIETLKSEIELLTQDNKTLEESLTSEKKAIEDERKSLGEKCTFLHFTQEQLNSQVENLECQVAGLSGQLEELKEQLATKTKELDQEKQKLTEFTELYVKENKELEVDFKKLKEVNEVLTLEVEDVKKANVQLVDNNSNLESELTAVKSDLNTELEAKEQLTLQVESVHADLEVANNDKGVLESEMKRLEVEKTAVEFDLAAVAKEKLTLQEEFDVVVADKKNMADAITDLKDQLAHNQNEVCKAKAEIADIEGQLCVANQASKELEATMAAEKKTLDEKDQIVEGLMSDLYIANLDKRELESKAVRLEEEKKSIELDLATVMKEKLALKEEIDVAEADQTTKSTMIKDLTDQLAESHNEMSLTRAKLAKFEEQLATIYAQSEDLQATIADKQKSLDAKEQILQELRSDLEEIEMRSSSLEGALSSSQIEVANLEAENKALLTSFESVEETLRSYIHQSQDLSAEVDNLRAAKADLNETCVILEKNVQELKTEIANNKVEMAEMVEEIEASTEALEMAKKHSLEMGSKSSDLQELVTLLEQRSQTDKEIYETETTGLREDLEELTLKNSVTHSELLEAKSANKELLEMNDEMSTQISEYLHSIKNLQDREVELNKRIEFVKDQLESAQKGMAVELDSHWQAEDEVLQLQSEIDQLMVQLKEANGNAQSFRQKCATKDEEKCALKSKFSEEISKLKTELKNKQREVEKVTKTGDDKQVEMEKAIGSLRDEIETNAANYKDHIQRLKTTVESKGDDVLRLTDSLRALKEELAGADVLTIRFKEMESLLKDYLEENTSLEEQVRELKNSKDEQAVLIDNLKTQLTKSDEEQSYKEKYEALAIMIEPFKEQLEGYEAEREMLLSRNQEQQGEVKKLASQYGRLLGHQNHKQKIQHLVKLKEDNVAMKEEICVMRHELDKYRRLALKHEKIRKGNKENNTTLATPSNHLSVSKQSLLSSIKKPDFSLLSCVSTPRRQTIGSPLTARNRPF